MNERPKYYPGTHSEWAGIDRLHKLVTGLENFRPTFTWMACLPPDSLIYKDAKSEVRNILYESYRVGRLFNMTSMCQDCRELFMRNERSGGSHE